MFVGVDLGTSSIKLILVNEKGQIINSVSETLNLLIPKPSWSEQDPNEWYVAFIKSLKALIKGYEKNIEGISFSGQMHGLVLLDENDSVLRNAILWNDQRTTKEVEALIKTFGEEKLLEMTGNIMLTGFTAPKILWIKNNEPEVYKQITKIMLPKDFLAYKITGNFASDVSDLSGTSFFDPKSKTYAKQILNFLGINETQLPEIRESYECIGNIKESIKQELNIKQDVKVIIGGGDQAVGAIGSSVISDGDCSISLGTSGVIFVASDKFVKDDVNHFQSYAHANGKYHLMAVMLNAASSVKWWNESILNDKNYEEYYRQVEDTDIDPNLFFLPYLTGERAPINDSQAKGVFYGLGIHHNQQDLNRAVVEGVTFALKESFEMIKELGIKIKKAYIIGGGAKSDVWNKMIADILNIEVIKNDTEEGPALGAAILAMVGCNYYQDIETACSSIIKTKKTYKPNQALTRVYESKFLDYKRLYPHLKNLFKVL
jgi:xylulokinase